MIRALGLTDAAYPSLLRVIADPPSPLYVRGDVVSSDAQAVAIVGTRRASVYGANVARVLGTGLARAGVTVVSGLARGIDAAAHQGAIEAGGRTIAVLGCGVDIAYPPEHRRLLAQVVAHGAVISEHPPGTPPLRYHFPRRNRLISGLSLGVIVVEGREDSGALITASAAAEQGREVFAVPGLIFDERSRAPHRLLQEGAKLVACVEDVLEELRLPAFSLAATPRARLEGPEQRVYAQVDLEPAHIDQLAQRAGLPVSQVARSLMTLECRGLIEALPGQRYTRRISDGATGAKSE
ncbi:MAG: DNA-processing protein DprA [bacterium]